MAQYQYTGSEYTRIELVKGEGKVKVVDGEIVESELPERNFLTNKFVKVEGTVLAEASEEVTEETETPKNTSKKSK